MASSGARWGLRFLPTGAIGAAPTLHHRSGTASPSWSAPPAPSYRLRHNALPSPALQSKVAHSNKSCQAPSLFILIPARFFLSFPTSNSSHLINAQRNNDNEDRYSGPTRRHASLVRYRAADWSLRTAVHSPLAPERIPVTRGITTSGIVPAHRTYGIFKPTVVVQSVHTYH